MTVVGGVTPIPMASRHNLNDDKLVNDIIIVVMAIIMWHGSLIHTSVSLLLTTCLCTHFCTFSHHSLYLLLHLRSLHCCTALSHLATTPTLPLLPPAAHFFLPHLTHTRTHAHLPPLSLPGARRTSQLGSIISSIYLSIFPLSIYHL